MNIFITGIAGFLGSHIAERFASQGNQVYGVDNLIGGDFHNIPESLRDNVTIDTCTDLARPDHPARKHLEKCEVMYHCAALAHEGLSVFSPAFISQNIYGTASGAFSGAIACGLRRIVTCSSMSRYGVGNPPFKETDPTAPVDPYGIAKVAAEHLLRMLSEVHGIEYVIAVPHNIIGPRQKYDDPFRNVASIMINRMLQGKPPIVYGDGRQVRCFSFVQDCVDALVMMAQAPISGETINIGPDKGEVRIAGLANLLAEMIGFEGDPIFMPGRPTEVREAYCSSDKARELLGYEATTPLRDGLQSMIDHIRKHGPKPFNYHLPVEITKGCPKTWTEKRI